MQWLSSLTFQEIRELSKHTNGNRYSQCMSTQQLYLYLLTNKASSEIIEEIIKEQRPKQIIELLLSQCVDKLLLNPLSPNLWTALSIQQYLTVQQLKILITIFFNSDAYVVNIDIEQRHTQNVKLKKNIFTTIKQSLSKMDWSQAVQILQAIYLQSASNVEDSLKIIELFFNRQQYRKNGQLQNSEKLKNQIIAGMRDVDSVFVSQLAINVYCELCRILRDDNAYTQCYVNLYTTLNSYGVHLIKDVWDDISKMVNQRVKLNYIEAEELVTILFIKVWHHKNQNVPKHCVKDFLKSQKVDKWIFLNQYMEVAYGIFIQMLNSGQFYTDSLLLMDSSFYKYIGRFYTLAFEAMGQEQKNHLILYFTSVTSKISNDQAIPAFLLPLKNIKINCRFFNKQLVQRSVGFINKVYNNLHVRKRWQLLDSIIQCLKYLDNVPLQSVISLITTIPDQAYSWSFIHDKQAHTHHNTFRIVSRLRQCLKAYDTKQYMEYLAENDIDKFYKMSRLVQHDFPDIRQEIKHTSQSCYSTINPKILRHLYWQLKYQSSQLDALTTLTLLTDKRINNPELIYLMCQLILTRSPDSRRYLAQFTQWVISNIHESYIFVEYLLAVLKCHCQYPSEYIEQCFYSLKLDVKQHRGLVLRVKLHLAMLLSQDKKHPNILMEQLLDQPIQLIDRYDYRQFPEMGVFLVRHYIPYALSLQKYDEIDQVQMVLKRALVTNLEYSMQKQEVMCYTNFIFDQRLVCCSKLLRRQFVSKWVAEAFKIGKDNIVMKRSVIDKVFLAIEHGLMKLIEQKTLIELVDVVLTMLQAEEYRGFDGEILFYQSNQNILLVRKNIPKNGEYYGAYPRFLFMDFIRRIISYDHQQVHAFVKSLCQRIILESVKDQSANKMLFTPPFRRKLRLWQAMQLFLPFLHKQPQLRKFMMEHMGTLLQQSNQYQIKFYIELFFTSFVLAYPSEAKGVIIGKIRQSGNSLNNSITYLIIGGLLLEKEFDRECFTVMLTYVCANTAYLRGLAQYFCFSKQLQFTLINRALYRQYVQNPDSIRLVTRLDQLIKGYKQILNSWSFQHFCKLQFFKAGEIVEQYHLDGLKKIGLEIVQDIKNTEEDFVGFGEVWKMESVSVTKGEEQVKSFQRKIDPVVQEVYQYNEKTQAKTKLRIISNSVQSLSNYGHLVRTSEIFSVQELIMSNTKILENEAFKIVSCTGQKWLPIKQVKMSDTLQYIHQLVAQGYQMITLVPSLHAKIIRMPKKALLILGNDNKQVSNLWLDLSEQISISQGLGLHVECAIAIWEYVKQHIILN